MTQTSKAEKTDSTLIYALLVMVVIHNFAASISRSNIKSKLVEIDQNISELKEQNK
jgi:hypothetical protein